MEYNIQKKIDLFNMRSDYLLYVQEYSSISLESFIELLFFNNQGHYSFESVKCEEYLRWVDNMGKPQKQYVDGQPFQYNPIVLLDVERTNKKGEKYITKQNNLLLNQCEGENVLDDNLLWKIKNNANAFMSPLTYVGHRAKYVNARFLYAFALDLDGVEETHIKDLFHQIDHEDIIVRLPRPNIIVNSGHGLHLYYLLENPIPMYHKYIKILNKLKISMVSKVWNSYTSSVDKQYQGIVQAFRMPESKTKFGTKVLAFYDENVPLWNIKTLNDYITSRPLTNDELSVILENKRMPNELTLEGAKLKYPDWYEKRIVRNEKKPNKWDVKQDLYYWWLNKIIANKGEFIREGYRYNCILTLVSFAVKCNIDYKILKEDAYSLVSLLDRYTENSTNHFTNADVKAALKAYKNTESAKKTINWIEKHTNCRIDKTKRNFRKQALHLQGARALQVIYNPNWREGNGRPKATADNSKHAKQIQKWRLDNPKGNKSQCARDLGMSRPTIIKWWNS